MRHLSTSGVSTLSKDRNPKACLECQGDSQTWCGRTESKNRTVDDPERWLRRRWWEVILDIGKTLLLLPGKWRGVEDFKQRNDKKMKCIIFPRLCTFIQPS